MKTCPICNKKLLSGKVVHEECLQRSDLFHLVNQERIRQDEKWGFPQHNTPAGWGIILGEETGEVLKLLNELHFRGECNVEELKEELIQVAAVALSMIEHMPTILEDNQR